MPLQISHPQMSNPARAPKEPTSLQLSLATAPDAYLQDGYQMIARSYGKVEVAQQILGKLDMTPRVSFYLPKDMCSEDSIRLSSKPVLAQARNGVPVARLRSASAKALVGTCFSLLPDTGFAAKEVVAAAMRNKVFVEGGVNSVLGRLAVAYPKPGESPSGPPTAAEAAAAVGRCGLRMRGLPAPALRPYPLIPKEGEVGVEVNPNSDNGFPVMGKWNTPGAAQIAMELATSVRQQITQTADVAAWKRLQEETRPWLVALKGKAKADYYTLDKVVGAKLRFYNVLGRQILMNMQVATQVMELNARHIMEGDYTSGIGITLVRGGAADLVDALEGQLKRDGVAYVHVGDDSWVVVKYGADIVMFALDCSNFDLTQHAAVTLEPHRAIHRELALIDKPAADLWLAYARDRMVVVQGALVRQFLHAGPSGMPLQSKVNDVLMDILVDRTLSRARRMEGLEDEFDRLVAEEGSRMGFSVRLEQYWRGRADTLREALEQRPFLFIGYYFHTRAGEVQVCADIPRTLAQVPYPAQKWAQDKSELELREAMRLGSIALNLGMPPRSLEPAVDAFRQGAMRLVEGALEKHGDVQDARLRWAVQESPWAFGAEASLRGLLRALKRDAAELWLVKELPLPSTSEFVSTSWADMIEEDEQAEVIGLGLSLLRPFGLRAKPRPLGSAVKPTHPWKAGNDGRPPPTAVWGPPKQPRSREVGRSTARQRRRDGIAYREFHEELDEDYPDSDESGEW